MPLSCRGNNFALGNAELLSTVDKLESVLRAFVRCHDVNGVHNTCRLIWNAALPLLSQTPSKQLNKAFTSAAQALAAVASPLHRLR